MATLYSHAESNIRRTWLYLTLFLVFTIIVGWVLSYALGTSLFLYVAVIYAVLVSFFGYWYSDKIVLKMSRARKIEKKDNPNLYRLVENLCITAGLPLPQIYIIQSDQPNAFATGRDPAHGVVAVTEGLLSRLEKSELEGVIAHELSHIGNRDALLSTIVVIFVGLIVVLSDFFLRARFWGGFRRRDDRGGGAQAAVMMAVALLLAILAPLAANLIKLAISRKREFLADASGALLTRYPEGLARALEKISKDSHPLRGANNATSHLYIVNPFKGQEKSSWIQRIFMTHPPTEERIKNLTQMKI